MSSDASYLVACRALQAWLESDGPVRMEPFGGVAVGKHVGMLAQIWILRLSIVAFYTSMQKEKYELVVCLAGLQSYSPADINMFQFRTKHA
jgi:hypothetical protein